MKRFLRTSIFSSLCVFLLITECKAESLSADDALNLVDAGEVLPLSEIISLHPVLSESRLLDIELEREDNGDLIYEFEILKAENLVLELEIDAATGQLIREEFEE
jgi:uncharacterized membrane protein YkoI